MHGKPFDLLQGFIRWIGGQVVDELAHQFAALVGRTGPMRAYPPVRGGERGDKFNQAREHGWTVITRDADFGVLRRSISGLKVAAPFPARP